MISKSRSIFASLFLPFAALGTLFLVFVLYLPTQAKGGTYVVNTTADTNDGSCNVAHCTLREAILAANTSAEADTITFSLSPSSTITLNGTQLPIITGTLTIDGSTATNLTISGDNASRLFVIGQLPPPYPRPDTPQLENGIGSTTVVTLTNLILTDGLENFGGGISNSGILTIIDSTITEMSAYRGGIYSDNTLIIFNTTFINNNITTGSGAGAGIYNTGQGTVEVMSSAFINNSVINFTAIGGGAIYNDSGTLTVTDSIFNGNSYYGDDVYGDGGGAIGQESDFDNHIYVSNSTFISNTSELRGGAIMIVRSRTVTITNSTFTGNSAEEGGAIWGVNEDGIVIQDSEFNLNSAESGGAIRAGYIMSITNSTFSENSADLYGGAIIGNSSLFITGTIFSNNTSVNSGGAISFFYTGGPLSLQNSTLMGNVADKGGALYVAGDVNVANSTLTGNSADLGGAFYVQGNLVLNNTTLNSNIATTAGAGIYNNNVLRFSNNIIANSTGGADCVNNGGINVNINNLIEDGTCNPLLTGDPLLGPLQDNGGTTWTHALMFGSPAIDAGDPTTCANPLVNNLDQRGEIRPVDGDGDGMAVCDIGAYEAPSPQLNLVKNGPSLVAVGDFITYTLTAVNNLTTTVTNVVLTDTLPTNATYISGGTLVGNVVSWTLPSLAVGETFTRSFVVTATETITNYDYRVSAAGGYSTTGSVPVVTIVVEPITGLAATNDSPTTVGNMTTFMASVTTGDDVSYAWAFGDGATGSGANPAHVYPGVGVYTAVVTATNSVSTMTATTIVTVEQDTWTIYLPVVLKEPD